MLDDAVDAGKLAVVSHTYGQRLVRLVADKVRGLGGWVGGCVQRGMGKGAAAGRWKGQEGAPALHAGCTHCRRQHVPRLSPPQADA